MNWDKHCPMESRTGFEPATAVVPTAAHPNVLPARIRRHPGGDIPIQLGIWIISITLTSPVMMCLTIMEFGNCCNGFHNHRFIFRFRRLAFSASVNFFFFAMGLFLPIQVPPRPDKSKSR